MGRRPYDGSPRPDPPPPPPPPSEEGIRQSILEELRRDYRKAAATANQKVRMTMHYKESEGRANDSEERRMVLCVGVMLAALMIAGWSLCSWAEASAYERVTGKHVSTWSAMWLDLRVQDSPK